MLGDGNGHGERRLRPGDHVGQGHVVVQLQVRRSDNGLGGVIGLRGHRNDRLGSQFRFASARALSVRAAGIERAQIFSGCVVDHVARAEAGRFNRLRMPRPEGGDRPNGGGQRDMRKGGFEEPAPGRSGGDEDVRPKVPRLGSELERRGAAGPDRIRQVAEKDAMPGFDFDQQLRRSVEAFPELRYGFHKPRALFHSFPATGQKFQRHPENVFGQNPRQPCPRQTASPGELPLIIAGFGGAYGAVLEFEFLAAAFHALMCGSMKTVGTVLAILWLSSSLLRRAGPRAECTSAEARGRLLRHVHLPAGW